jgi:hypothetical protein
VITGIWEDSMKVASLFRDLLGETFKSITVEDAKVIFNVGAYEYHLEHDFECCEEVYIEDICGDIQDLIGSPILASEEVCSQDKSSEHESQWTFYKLSTNKGSVTIRWHGSSNGYYSIAVDLYLVRPQQSPVVESVITPPIPLVVKYPNKDYQWYSSGERHRTDGPAIEQPNEEITINGAQYRLVKE